MLRHDSFLLIFKNQPSPLRYKVQGNKEAREGLGWNDPFFV